jgi:hypothetical protein
MGWIGANRKPRVGTGDMVFWHLVLLGVTIYFMRTYLCIGSDLLIQFKEFISKATYLARGYYYRTFAGPQKLHALHYV